MYFCVIWPNVVREKSINVFGLGRKNSLGFYAHLGHFVALLGIRTLYKGPSDASFLVLPHL